MHRNSSEKCIFGDTVFLSFYLAPQRLYQSQRKSLRTVYVFEVNQLLNFWLKTFLFSFNSSTAMAVFLC